MFGCAHMIMTKLKTNKTTSKKNTPKIKPLEINTSIIHNVDYEDLEHFINKIYKKKTYSFLEDQEVTNYSCVDFYVGNKKLNKFEKKDFDAWLAGEKSDRACITELILEDLHVKGLIPEGHYLVHVSW